MDLTIAQLIPPAEDAGIVHWSLLLFPEEGRKASKTGQFNTSIMVDNPDFPYLSVALRNVKNRLPKNAHLVNLTYLSFAKLFQSALAALQLLVLEAVPYCLRHSGASMDMLAGRRSTPEIKLRGRWKADASMARYAKGGRLAEQWGRLPATVKATCGQLAGEIGKMFTELLPA